LTQHKLEEKKQKKTERN